MSWDPTELGPIAVTDDLHVSPLRTDGRTFGTPTWIWSVVVDGNLYVRAANGQASRWYEAARTQKAGRIHAAGLTKGVQFELVADELFNDRIDEAYDIKYRGSPYLAPMINAKARSATVKITPS